MSFFFYSQGRGRDLNTYTNTHRFVYLFVGFWLDQLRSDWFVPSHCLSLLYFCRQLIFLCSLWNNYVVSHFVCVTVQKHLLSKKRLQQWQRVSDDSFPTVALFFWIWVGTQPSTVSTGFLIFKPNASVVKKNAVFHNYPVFFSAHWSFSCVFVLFGIFVVVVLFLACCIMMHTFVVLKTQLSLVKPLLKTVWTLERSSIFHCTVHTVLCVISSWRRCTRAIGQLISRLNTKRCLLHIHRHAWQQNHFPYGRILTFVSPSGLVKKKMLGANLLPANK